jgi:hypothetical protein
MLSLVQIEHSTQGRRVARVTDGRLSILNRYRSAYACANAAIQNREPLVALIERATSDAMLDYDAIYAGQSEWRLLPAWDHPDEPARCLVSGTGLTHRKSADNRNAMHQADASQTTAANALTDSMKMYAWGEQGGRPEPGAIGAQPEWFYKGSGTILRAHGEPLDVPSYAEDGGEEAEIAAAYLIDAEGDPWRVGFAQGNEFSDHRLEARSYLYLAPSKLRVCSLGPELIVGGNFEDVQGSARVERDGQTLWTQDIASGNANMVHTLANLEHHHFKYAAHRRSGDAHVHFFGTGGFSFGSGLRLEDGDEMIVTFDNYGRPLRNPLRVESGPDNLREVRVL